MPSSAQQAAQAAAERVRKARGIDVHIAPSRLIEATSSSDLGAHTEALYALFSMCANLCRGPLHVVIRPDPIRWLHVRADGLPSMVNSIPRDRVREVLAAADSIKSAGARLLLDPGGFLVLYGDFPDDS